MKTLQTLEEIIESYDSLTEMDFAYIAGIIDGEGSIRIFKQPQAKTYSLTIGVANTSIELLEWLKSKLGGSFAMGRDGDDNHKPVYYWTLSSVPSEALLYRISKYLVIKRDRAQTALMFRLTFEDFRGGYGGTRVSEENLKLREQCFQDLKKLNLRGPASEEGD